MVRRIITFGALLGRLELVFIVIELARWRAISTPLPGTRIDAFANWASPIFQVRMLCITKGGEKVFCRDEIFLRPRGSPPQRRLSVQSFRGGAADRVAGHRSDCHLHYGIPGKYEHML